MNVILSNARLLHGRLSITVCLTVTSIRLWRFKTCLCHEIKLCDGRDPDFSLLGLHWLVPSRFGGFYCVSSAKLELCFSEFPSLHSSRWARAAGRNLLLEIWNVAVKQQPCSFCAGKVSDGPEVTLFVASLLPHLGGMGQQPRPQPLTASPPSASLNPGPGVYAAP